ncbi:MAG: GDSL-type esterase/lipase family protein [Acidobacteriaceae bacterium]
MSTPIFSVSVRAAIARFTEIGAVGVFSASLLLPTTGCNLIGGGSKPANGPHSSNAGNFSTTVFIGDSLTAGFQNGSLLDTQQPNGYANLIANQAGFKLALPLIAAPGAPAVLQLVSVGPPVMVKQASGVTTGRDDVTVQATDLAVPGHLLTDLLNREPVAIPTTDEDIITDLVLGFPGLASGELYTQLQWAEHLRPTTLFVWIGSNDALLAVHSGVPSSMTQPAQFATEFTQLMQALQTNTTANLIVANVPDITLVAAFTPGSVVLAEYSQSSGIPVAQLSTELGIRATDLVNATGISEIQAILAGKQAGPVDDSGFLSPAEVATVQQTIQQYNTAIADQVKAMGGTLVDMNAALTQIHDSPPTINGIQPSFAFLGGFFSLDGVHPTNTGYAMLANIFIDRMNTALKTKIADVDVSAVAAADPLFPPNLPKSARRISIPATAAHSLDWMLTAHARNR